MMPLPPLREVIARHGLRARKSLGQNFLLDLNLAARIARAAGPLDKVCVIEVGPGPGGLTRALLETGAAKVIAIERDPRCIPALGEIEAVSSGRLTVIHGNALDTDYAKLARGRVSIVANLPYNIATALTAGWLTSEPWPPWYQSMTLMFQREVADRLHSAPGGRTYGRLSVLAQWRTQVSKLFDVDARAFTPPPKVTSSLVQFIVRDKPLAAGPPGTLEGVTRAAFGQRRKMLRASLKTLVRDPKPLLDAAGIDGALRAEDLDVEAFCRLAEAFAGTSQGGAGLADTKNPSNGSL